MSVNVFAQPGGRDLVYPANSSTARTQQQAVNTLNGPPVSLFGGFGPAAQRQDDAKSRDGTRKADQTYGGLPKPSLATAQTMGPNNATDPAAKQSQPKPAKPKQPETMTAKTPTHETAIQPQQNQGIHVGNSPFLARLRGKVAVSAVPTPPDEVLRSAAVKLASHHGLPTETLEKTSNLKYLTAPVKFFNTVNKGQKALRSGAKAVGQANRVTQSAAQPSRALSVIQHPSNVIREPSRALSVVNSPTQAARQTMGAGDVLEGTSRVVRQEPVRGMTNYVDNVIDARRVGPPALQRATQAGTGYADDVIDGTARLVREEAIPRGFWNRAKGGYTSLNDRLFGTANRTANRWQRAARYGRGLVGNTLQGGLTGYGTDVALNFATGADSEFFSNAGLYGGLAYGLLPRHARTPLRRFVRQAYNPVKQYGRGLAGKGGVSGFTGKFLANPNSTLGTAATIGGLGTLQEAFTGVNQADPIGSTNRMIERTKQDLANQFGYDNYEQGIVDARNRYRDMIYQRNRLNRFIGDVYDPRNLRARATEGMMTPEDFAYFQQQGMF